MAKTLRNSKLADAAAETVIADYRLAYSSRRASIIGRAEVLRGNATFGIFGGGKEAAQVAMAKAFRPGDWRAGVDLDQTFTVDTRMAHSPEIRFPLLRRLNTLRVPVARGPPIGERIRPTV